MAYEFHYTPTGTGAISGKEVLEQTEDAINDLGNTAISGVQEALDKAEQALTNSENAVDDAQTALNTANNAEGVAIQAQNDVSNLSGTVTNIGNRVTTAEGNIGNLQGRMTTAEGNITNIQGRMTTAEGNIGNLQTAVSTAQATANSAQQTATTARQQSYVFRYSSTALTASSTNSNALLDNTNNLKVGDKVIDSSGVIYSVTAIDTANSTFTIGTSLIDLAQDSDVVHKSGNETVNGNKTFGNGTLTVDNTTGSNVHGEIKLNGSRPGYIVADDASDGVFDSTECGVSILLSDSNKPLHIGGYKVDSNGRIFADKTNKKRVLSISSSLVKTSVLVPENETVNPVFRILSELNYANGNSSKTLDVRFIQYDNANATSAIYSNDDGKTSLGTASKKWDGIYATNYYYGNDNVEFSRKFVTTDTAQTVSGAKTFSDTLTIYNNDSSQATKNLTISSSKIQVGDTSNSDSFGIVFNAGLSYVSRVIAFKDTSGTQNLQLAVRTKDSSNNFISSMIRLRLFANGFSIFEPDGNNLVSLGSSSNKWKDVNTYLVNGLEPSSLSLPSQTTYVDISSYFTNTGTGEYNTYTAPSNGWIFLRLGDISSCQARVLDSSDNILWGTSSSGSLEMITIPILSGCKLQTQWATGSVVNVAIARFIPCQGNV